MSSANMKGYYKQKKNPSTTTANKSSKSFKKPPIHATTSNVQPPPATVVSRNSNPDLQDEHVESESVLRQFDINMKYGPCIGMTRSERWERAVKLGLNPPEEIQTLLKSGKVQQKSLWDAKNDQVY